MTHRTLKWKLFPFSLIQLGKEWYTRIIRSMNGDWKELRDRFCLTFFLLSRVYALRAEILTFRQSEKESIGAA
jgi:hypothetical protein